MSVVASVTVFIITYIYIYIYKRRVSVQFSIIFRIDHRPHYSPHQTNLWVNLNQQRRFTSPTHRAPSARSDCCGRMDAHGVHTSERAPKLLSTDKFNSLPLKNDGRQISFWGPQRFRGDAGLCQGTRWADAPGSNCTMLGEQEPQTKAWHNRPRCTVATKNWTICDQKRWQKML